MPQVGGFDKARFRRLLELVGPGQAPALLAQLRLDLAECDTAIASAVAGHDWDRLREASHVLISLAGSAGAMTLRDLALGLNAAAHVRDPSVLPGLLPRVSADLAALIHLVETTPAGAPQ